MICYVIPHPELLTIQISIFPIIGLMKETFISLQELLVHAGAVLWLDASVRMEDETQDADRAVEWSGMALKSGGVLTWPLPSPALLPSAALTHPNMFTFFHTKKHNYDFQQVRL